MKIAVVNTKGGVGKTTTAVYIASALHATGAHTIAVDADRQQSMTLWAQQEPGLPFPVVAHTMPHKVTDDLTRGHSHLVIDTPPGDLAVIESAVRAVDMVIVPVGATGLDVNRMLPTFELLGKIEQFSDFVVGVVLTKVRPRTRARRAAREVLNGLGYPVLDTEIPLLEQYAAAFGTYPGDELGAYDDLMREIKS